MIVELADSIKDLPWAGSILGIITALFLFVLTGLLAYVAKQLSKSNTILEVLCHEVIPDGQPSLRDQVADVRSDVRVLKDRGQRIPPTAPDQPN